MTIQRKKKFIVAHIHIYIYIYTHAFNKQYEHVFKYFSNILHIDQLNTFWTTCNENVFKTKRNLKTGLSQNVIKKEL